MFVYLYYSSIESSEYVKNINVTVVKGAWQAFIGLGMEQSLNPALIAEHFKANNVTRLTLTEGRSTSLHIYIQTKDEKSTGCILFHVKAFIYLQD